MEGTLELRLPERINFELEKVAQLKKEPKEKIALFAILSYLEEFSNLKEEFRLWDTLSDEAFLNFEKSMNQ